MRTSIAASAGHPQTPGTPDGSAASSSSSSSSWRRVRERGGRRERRAAQQEEEKRLAAQRALVAPDPAVVAPQSPLIDSSDGIDVRRLVFEIARRRGWSDSQLSLRIRDGHNKAYLTQWKNSFHPRALSEVTRRKLAEALCIPHQAIHHLARVRASVPQIDLDTITPAEEPPAAAAEAPGDPEPPLPPPPATPLADALSTPAIPTPTVYSPPRNVPVHAARLPRVQVELVDSRTGGVLPAPAVPAGTTPPPLQPPFSRDSAATAAAGAGGGALDYVIRPFLLMHSGSAIAVRIEGRQSEPRWMHNDLVYFAPGHPLRVGDGVCVYLTATGERIIGCLGMLSEERRLCKVSPRRGSPVVETFNLDHVVLSREVVCIRG